jgi:hypothetical protein
VETRQRRLEEITAEELGGAVRVVTQ